MAGKRAISASSEFSVDHFPEELAPVHFLSHGTAALLQENSRVRDYWQKLGQDARDHGCKGVIIMVRPVSPQRYYL